MNKIEKIPASAGMVRSEIRQLIERGNVTREEVLKLRCNSWEWEALIPALDNEALIARTRHAIANAVPKLSRPCSTYDEAIAQCLAPELVKRLQRIAEKK